MLASFHLLVFFFFLLPREQPCTVSDSRTLGAISCTFKLRLLSCKCTTLQYPPCAAGLACYVLIPHLSAQELQILFYSNLNLRFHAEISVSSAATNVFQSRRPELKSRGRNQRFVCHFPLYTASWFNSSTVNGQRSLCTYRDSVAQAVEVSTGNPICNRADYHGTHPS